MSEKLFKTVVPSLIPYAVVIFFFFHQIAKMLIVIQKMLQNYILGILGQTFLKLHPHKVTVSLPFTAALILSTHSILNMFTQQYVMQDK